MDFNPFGKLNLGIRSVIQLTVSTASITSNGPSSEQIIIGRGIKYNGSNDGTVTNVAAQNSTTTQAKAGFSFVVLPVQLTSFTAHSQAGKVVLNWTTALEDGLQYFELQRSVDGKGWQTIAVLQSKNTCQCITNYRYEDRSPETGISYYRLRLFYDNGRMEWSAIVIAKWHPYPSKEVSWHINGADSALSLSFHPNHFQFPIQLQLLTTNGQVILHQKITSTSTNINIKDLPRGVAIQLLEDRSRKKTAIKMVK